MGGGILSVILYLGIIFTVFRNHFRFQFHSEHLLELQIVEAKRFGTVHLRTLDDLSVFHNRHAIRVTTGQQDVEAVLLGAQKSRMGFEVRQNGGPRRAVGRDVLGGVATAEQRGDGCHVQVEYRTGFHELHIFLDIHRT